MKPVKKAKVRQARRDEIEHLMDPRTQKKFQRDADNAFIDFEETVDARYEYARDILKLQNERVLIIVGEMIENMKRMAGEPSFVFKGVMMPVDKDKMRKIQERNFTWIAVRLLAACAVWDIQISGFVLPEYACARCGVGTRPKKRR